MAVDLVILSVVFVSITVVSIAIRLFTRTVILKNIGVDDYLICVGAVFAIVCSVTPIAALQYGLGRPTADQKPEQVAPYQKLLLTSSVTYSVSATFIKLSLLSFYLRLSNGPAFSALVYCVIFAVIGFGIGSITAVLLQCLPLSSLWDEDAAVGAKCIKLVDFYYANAAINLTADVVILFLPIKILWGLHMPLRQRIGLCGLFGLGGLATVAGIIRLSSLKSLLASSNPTINIVTPLNWSFIELNTAIFIAGAPALKAFLRQYMPALLGSSYSPTGITKYGSSNKTGTKSRPTKHNSIPLGSVSDKNGSKWVKNTAVVSSGPGHENGNGERDSDNDSQENILQNYHGILQEVTVSVKSERKSEEGRSMSSGKADY
ncbi:hypothetical protein DPSP01_011264 [Paraphaeosphaeria sporulosa]|uniref:Rhodopsin domain-containing protein n=1 Tax=Paraphaeosphaeria sporulosa TaxID=1460663 RepID=A0A177BWS4_9PLEO|nr:uncharacterized protein CC84DRAFT_366040 [Paraphaeosphaeria sporulosa]OAF99585.1 hypothetical protein CC84DRAFT_366040 [Paraphaeosphaeria sporulosa]